MKSCRPLGEVLANRRWVRCEDPFPHVRADDVFVPEVHDEIAATVRAILERGTGVSSFGWYDALGWSFRSDTPWPLQVFLSADWHDMIAGIAGVNCTGHVSGGIHSHAVGSLSGTLHNDLNPVYFPVRDDPPEIQVVSPEEVEYMTGRIRAEGAVAQRVVRAVALLYYVGNDDWRPGDGGATGLYARRGQAVSKPDVAVLPVDNSLVMFECTPRSFHTFLTNRRIVRNSVIMWLHREYEAVVDRWGESSLVLWSDAAVEGKALVANQGATKAKIGMSL